MYVDAFDDPRGGSAAQASAPSGYRKKEWQTSMLPHFSRRTRAQRSGSFVQLARSKPP